MYTSIPYQNRHNISHNLSIANMIKLLSKNHKTPAPKLGHHLLGVLECSQGGPKWGITDGLDFPLIIQWDFTVI